LPALRARAQPSESNSYRDEVRGFMIQVDPEVQITTKWQGKRIIFSEGDAEIAVTVHRPHWRMKRQRPTLVAKADTFALTAYLEAPQRYMADGPCG
jgi:hypothetical protein